MNAKFSFPIILILFLLSCSDQYNDIPDIGRKIVLNGLITTDSLINVHITRSAYINDISGQSYDLLEDLDSVDVQLYEDGKLIDSLYHDPFYFFDIWNVFNTGNYISRNMLPKPGEQYKIIVKAQNFPVASSSITIPALVDILKVDTIGFILPLGSYTTYNKGVICRIEFIDPPNEKNYYLFNIRNMITPNYFSTDNNLEFSCNDPIVEEKLFSGDKNVGIAFSDRLINGQKYILNVLVKRESIQVYTGVSEQTVCFRLYSITKDFFDYIHNLNIYSKNFGNPFYEPIMVHSNVTGGYGMFSGASVSSDSIVFKVIGY